MKAVVVGAGRMGVAAAFDLARCEDVTEVVLVDKDEARAVEGAARAGAKARGIGADLSDPTAMRDTLAGARGVLSASSYTLNEAFTRAAIDAGAHFVDLGGNNDVVARQRGLHARAAARGVTVIPDCGLAPGMAGWLGARLARGFDRCDSLRIRVGGLPIDRPAPLEYRLVFSVEGLVNEYKEPCLVVRGGKTLRLPGLSEIEPLEDDFPPPFSRLECFHTSGGLSTLPETLAGQVRDMEYKTIRYPGHAERVRLLFALGLADEQPIAIDGVRVAPRKVLEACLERTLSGPVDDVVLLRVDAVGAAGGRVVRRVNRIVDRFDRSTGHSAMARTTAYPAAVALVAAMRGRCAPGVVPGEVALDLDDFVTEVKARGIAIEEFEVAESAPVGQSP